MDEQPEATAFTYEDAARACGVTAETIRLRARRGKLRRGRPTNTGRPTVLLTEAEIAAIRAGRPFRGGVTGHPDVQPPGQPEQPDVQPTGQHSTISALAGHVTTLREQLAKGQADFATMTEQLSAERDREREAADHARRAGELDRAGWAEERAKAAEREARDAEERLRLQARVDELAAELARLQAAAAPPAARPRSWLTRFRRRRRQ
jgi:uncharacterized coiled-coil protein SlyX